MLDNPVLENPVNLEAATMFKKRPIQYKQMVLDCVFTSKRLEGMLYLHYCCIYLSIAVKISHGRALNSHTCNQTIVSCFFV